MSVIPFTRLRSMGRWYGRGLSVVITDPWRADNPIIFASPEFTAITGHPLRDVIGRNCRFLQGPGTDPRAVEAIARAVGECRDIEIDILNYRNGGEAFWNRLRLRPHFLGETRVPRFFIAVQQVIEAPDPAFLP